MLVTKYLLGVLSPFIIGAAQIVAAASNIQVSSTVLVLARSEAEGYSATSGFNGYGIPYKLFIIPQDGATLPALNSSATQGNYGGIVVLGEVSYGYTDGWYSALTTAQWNQMYDYQNAFNVRMVRIDVYPSDGDFGTETSNSGQGCCDDGVEQLMYFTNTTAFPLAGLKTGAAAGVTQKDMFHYPATITNASIATEIAAFAPSTDNKWAKKTTAAVINTFGTRQQMVFFTSWATDWSESSNFLQHAYIWWMTRGLFAGRRRVYVGTQIDDMGLSTDIYSPSGTTFRLTYPDLVTHATWQTALNKRLPTGSNYTIEIGHNGNGDIDVVSNTLDTTGACNPETAIYYDYVEAPLEYIKPIGTGVNVWPSTPKNYTWSVACAKQDPLTNWFMTAANRDNYLHISHTFSHYNLNNSTYSDAYKEIQFNQAWLAQVGIAAGRFSPKGLIPPAISGMHNGDAIRAWMDLGLTSAVGDNSRPLLLNAENEFWPLMSNISNNGYMGLTIIPRYGGPIYFNCDLPACTLKEWVETSSGTNNYTVLLDYIRSSQTRNLLALHQDLQMFHQANMRITGQSSSTIGTQTGKFSLLQTWVEVVMQEYIRLVTWPVLTLKQDDLAVAFQQRMTRDKCGYNLIYNYASNGKSVSGVTVTSKGNVCPAPIPITFPIAASLISSNKPMSTFTSEQIGNDPLTLWVPLKGSPVTFTFSTPITL